MKPLGAGSVISAGRRLLKRISPCVEDTAGAQLAGPEELIPMTCTAGSAGCC